MGSRYNRGRYNQRQNKGKDQRPENVDEENPIIKAFQQFSVFLDEKHDRFERIVKLSRDITIESKRIIFLLHNIDGRKNNKEQILEEAQERLNKVIEVNFKSIARELLGQDIYQYRNAYSAGLQEFIEAYTFMEYLHSTGTNNALAETKESNLSDWNILQQKMQYTAEDNTVEDEKQRVESIKTFEFKVDPHEYILGLSDLTGELMRRCINSLGSGETDACLETCKVLQQFYTGYFSLSLHRSRELSRKISTMRQSVLKSENVCYNVKVRGGEAAKWGAVFETKPLDDVDEGFF